MNHHYNKMDLPTEIWDMIEEYEDLRPSHYGKSGYFEEMYNMEDRHYTFGIITNIRAIEKSSKPAMQRILLHINDLERKLKSGHHEYRVFDDKRHLVTYIRLWLDEYEVHLHATTTAAASSSTPACSLAPTARSLELLPR